MANDFSSDSNCLCLYNCESGALGTDSQGSIDLANASIDADTTNFKQGSASALANDLSDQLWIADASLPAGFPGKSGTTNRTISLCGWIRPAGVEGWHAIASKYSTGDAKRSWALNMDGAEVKFSLGYNAGASFEEFSHAGVALSANQWYHVAATYNGSSKAWRIRVWDDTGSSVTESTGTGIQTMNLEDTEFTLFGRDDNIGAMLGNIDELVLFDDVLTADEIDQIRAGTYGASSSSSSLSSSSLSSSSSSLSSASSVSSSSSASSVSSSSSSSSSASYSFSSSSTSSAGPLEFVSLGKGVDMAIREEGADAGLLASDPSAGRRLVTDPIYKAAHRHKLTISYMSVTDRILLARFYLTTTTGACRVWEWTHPTSAQVWLLRFDPQVPPVYGRHAEQPDKHHAELTVLEDITDGYVLGVYDR